MPVETTMEPVPRCPLVNPLCPTDLCVLEAGHKWSGRGRHLLGTMYGSVLDPSYPDEDQTKYALRVSPHMFLAPVGTDDDELIRLGNERADLLDLH